MTVVDNVGHGLRMVTRTAGSYGNVTNSIFANNGGHGLSLESPNGTFTSTEGANVFFNDDIVTNDAVKVLSNSTSTADPLFQANGTRPAPWYWIGSRSSPAYKTASDSGNRGAYQNEPLSHGTVLIIQ